MYTTRRQALSEAGANNIAGAFSNYAKIQEQNKRLDAMDSYRKALADKAKSDIDYKNKSLDLNMYKVETDLLNKQAELQGMDSNVYQNTMADIQRRHGIGTQAPGTITLPDTHPTEQKSEGFAQATMGGEGLSQIGQPQQPISLSPSEALLFHPAVTPTPTHIDAVQEMNTEPEVGRTPQSIGEPEMATDVQDVAREPAAYKSRYDFAAPETAVQTSPQITAPTGINSMFDNQGQGGRILSKKEGEMAVYKQKQNFSNQQQLSTGKELADYRHEIGTKQDKIAGYREDLTKKITSNQSVLNNLANIEMQAGQLKDKLGYLQGKASDVAGYFGKSTDLSQYIAATMRTMNDYIYDSTGKQINLQEMARDMKIMPYSTDDYDLVTKKIVAVRKIVQVQQEMMNELHQNAPELLYGNKGSASIFKNIGEKAAKIYANDPDIRAAQTGNTQPTTSQNIHPDVQNALDIIKGKR